MRKILILLLIALAIRQPVCAMDFTAPAAPESAQKYMPAETKSFYEDICYVLKNVLEEITPGFVEAMETCLCVAAVSMLISIIRNLTETTHHIVGLAAVVSIGILLFRSANTLLQLGTQTVEQLSDYGKLLIPTLTAATAASGTTARSTALYTGTMIFSTVLSSVVSYIVVPLIYVFMALGIGDNALGGKTLGGLKDFVRWLSTWIIKIVLYVFTGYMGIAGVVSGSVDATAIKATKLTISGVVPVVGSIISDASEAILLSAGIMKNSAGIYGIVAIVAICIGPFLRIGIHYLLLKVTAAICSVFSDGPCSGIMKDMTGAMGLVLAMTGAVSLLLLISVVCFLRSI